MAHKKQGGKLRIQSRKNAKYLGLKVSHAEPVESGVILVRQRGTKIKAGKNVRVGRDHSLYSVSKGKVKFTKKLGRSILSVN